MSRFFRYDPKSGQVIEVTRAVHTGIPRYPLPCEAMAVHPTQIKEFMAFDRCSGVPTEYRADGTPMMRDARHYKRYRRAHRYHMKNSFDD